MPTDDARTRFLRALIDDAGLFPPARLPMTDAVAGHVRAQRGPYAWIQGRFLCPASRLTELGAALEGHDDAVGRLGVILDRHGSEDWEAAVGADLEAAAAFSAEKGVRVDAVETPLPVADAAEVAEAVLGLVRRLPAGVTPYLEVPPGRPDAVKGIAVARAEAQPDAVPGAKIRCGGLTPDAFPSPDAVAAFLTACARAGVPAKATAGLHHPIRHHDDAHGWWEHGFVNVVGAAVLAAGGDGETSVAQMLADDDPEAFALGEDGFAWRGRKRDPGAVAAGRALLVAYGSCSFDEPIAGLTALGMLP